MGTFPRVTLPSAGAVLLRPLDLHVLSLPPAFALSQDQTLKFLDENLISAGHFTFDEVPPLVRARSSPLVIAHARACRFHDKWC